MTTALLLVAFAALVANRGPALLLRSKWSDRAPRLGILTWQALSLSPVIAVVLAGMVLAIPAIPVTADVAAVLDACAQALSAGYLGAWGAVAGSLGAAAALVVIGRAGYCLVAVQVASWRERRRQLDALLRIGRRHVSWDALVVDHPAAAAYCVPGRRHQIVLTTAALRALDDRQLAAVLAHEQAHVQGRHDLVLGAAASLRRAFPRIRLFRDAERETMRLVEMLADDVAARSNERLTIATALVCLAEVAAPPAALNAGGATSLARVRRLVSPAQPLGVHRSALAVLTVVALLAAPVAVVALCSVAVPWQQITFVG